MDMVDHVISSDSSPEPSPPMRWFSSRDFQSDNDTNWPKTKLSDLLPSSPDSLTTRQGNFGVSPVPVDVISTVEVDQPSFERTVEFQASSGPTAIGSSVMVPRKRKDSPDFSGLHCNKRPLFAIEDIAQIPEDFDYVQLSPERPNVITSAIHAMSDSEPDVSDSECRIIDYADTQPSVSAHSSFPSRSRITQESTKGPNKRKVTLRDKTVINENRQIKLQQKANKAELARKLRCLKPGQSIKYITVVLGTNVRTEPWGSPLIESLTLTELKHRIECLPDNNCITWDLNSLDDENKQKHVLVIWYADQIITNVKFGILMDAVNEIKSKFLGYKVNLAGLNLRDAYKKIKRNQNRDFREKCKNGNPAGPTRPEAVSVDDIEMKLDELLILSGVSNRPVDDKSFTQFIQKITRSVSERPFKSRREKKDHEYKYFARGDSKNCVRVDKDMNGLTQLWLQQLCQVTLATLDMAKAIATVYPSPVALSKAYDACSTQSEKELLLQNLVMKRGWGPGASSRRLGPQMSKKMFVLFGTTDGSVTLNQR